MSTKGSMAHGCKRKLMKVLLAGNAKTSKPESVPFYGNKEINV